MATFQFAKGETQKQNHLWGESLVWCSQRADSQRRWWARRGERCFLIRRESWEILRTSHTFWQVIWDVSVGFAMIWTCKTLHRTLSKQRLTSTSTSVVNRGALQGFQDLPSKEIQGIFCAEVYLALRVLEMMLSDFSPFTTSSSRWQFFQTANGQIKSFGWGDWCWRRAMGGLLFVKL